MWKSLFTKLELKQLILTFTMGFINVLSKPYLPELSPCRGGPVPISAILCPILRRKLVVMLWLLPLPRGHSRIVYNNVRWYAKSLSTVRFIEFKNVCKFPSAQALYDMWAPPQHTESQSCLSKSFLILHSFVLEQEGAPAGEEWVETQLILNFRPQL